MTSHDLPVSVAFHGLPWLLRSPRGRLRRAARTFHGLPRTLHRPSAAPSTAFHRPSTAFHQVETWFYMWYYTRDPKWRDMGWTVFESFER